MAAEGQRNLRENLSNANDAWEGAIMDEGLNPAEMNNRLRKFGGRSFVVGIGIAGVSVKALTGEQPNNRPIFLDVIPFLAGIFAIFVGWFLMCSNNPGRYLYLANFAMLALAFGFVFAAPFY